jgi:hypothetical protein
MTILGGIVRCQGERGAAYGEEDGHGMPCPYAEEVRGMGARVYPLGVGAVAALDAESAKEEESRRNRIRALASIYRCGE